MDFNAHCQIHSVEANLKFKFLILSTIGKCPHLLKWVIVRIAAYFCASLSQIWIPDFKLNRDLVKIHTFIIQKSYLRKYLRLRWILSQVST